MLVRPATAADHDAIHDLVATAFDQPDEAVLVDRLRRDGDVAIELVVADGEAPVGHVLFSRLRAPFRALALAPLSVRENRRREGIGARLVGAGLERAAHDGWQGAFVLGDPAYYTRFGFDAALAATFACAYAGPYLMATALGGTLPVTTGQIDYPAAFSAL
ncbi:MAG: N-acetyltransferase [Alphaproteobacteria bacterium]